MIEEIEKLMIAFNDEVNARPAFKEALKDFNRTVQIEFLDDDFACHMNIHDGEVGLLCPGPMQEVEDPDLKIITEAAILKGIIERSVNPVDAYYNDDIKIKGSIFDKLRLKHILSENA